MVRRVFFGIWYTADIGGVSVVPRVSLQSVTVIAAALALMTVVAFPVRVPAAARTTADVQNPALHIPNDMNFIKISAAPITSATPTKVPLLVVCAAFAGKPATKPISVFQNLYFGDHQSVASYYKQVSYGQLELTGTVVGDPLHPGHFLPLPHTEAYYAKTENGSAGNFPNNDDGIVTDAVHQLLKDRFSFQPYAVNGQIPYLAIVFSGYGADVAPGDQTLIWPVESSLQYALHVPLNGQKIADRMGLKFEKTSATDDVATVSSYDLVPELDDATGDAVTLGVLAHEFGHLLGLMDVYDVSSDPNAGQGVGPFSLMGTGNWNGFPSGEQPAGLDPLSLEYLGWIKPEVIAESETGVLLPPLETEPVVYRLNPLHDPGEYFLLSNEQAIGVDVALPDTGVFIWRVDAKAVNPNGYDWQNDVLDAPSMNKSHHYDLAIVGASGKNDLAQPDGDVTDYQDAYPFAGNHRFTATSKPSNQLFDGGYLGLDVTQIAINRSTKWASFDVLDTQSGAALYIPRPASGLTLPVGVPVNLVADYQTGGVTTNVSQAALWSFPPDAESQGGQVEFMTPGRKTVSVSYRGLAALINLTVSGDSRL